MLYNTSNFGPILLGVPIDINSFSVCVHQGFDDQFIFLPFPFL